MFASTGINPALSRQIITGEQLTDDTISSVLDIISENTPHVRTLTPAILALHERFPLAQRISAAERSVLIAHLGKDRNEGHWECICSDHNSVSIFDSMNSLSNHRDDPQLTSIVQNVFTDVQSVSCVPVFSTQGNLNDCGVFALSYGVDWALGHDPSLAVYDTQNMRRYLLRLLQFRRLQRFPVLVTPSQGGAIVTLNSGGDLTLQGPSSTATNQTVSSASDTASEDNIQAKSATTSTTVQESASPRIDESLANKCHLWWLFDEVGTEIFYTVLVWLSPGWDQQSPYEDYLSSRGIAIGKLNKTQIDQLKSKCPKQAWDITFMHSLIKLSWTFVDKDHSKWSAKLGTNPQRSLTALKDARNTLAHTRKIDRKQRIALMKKVRKLTRKIQKGLKFVRRHPAMDLMTNPQKCEIDRKFQDILVEIDRIRNANLGQATFDRYAEQLTFAKKMEIIKERLPQLETHLRKFTAFSPVTQLLEPFSHLQVEVQDIFTEMIIEGESGNKEIKLENLLEHLPHDDSERLLLIKGHAGIGKSTVVRKLINDWLNKTRYIKELDSFDLVFHVECRHHIDSLRDLLVISLGDVHKSLNDKDLISATLAFKCLIIIDGFDEINSRSSKLVQDILAYKQSSNLSLIFTSRPEAEEKFNNKVKPDIKTITRIRLEGIPKENVEDFVRKYHSCISSQSSQTLNSLLKYLEKEKYRMSETWKSPYNLSILVILWSLGQDINNITTEAELHMKIFNLQSSKLIERLQRVESIQGLHLSTLRKHLLAFLCQLSWQALIGLKNDDILLSQSTFNELTSVSNKMALPAEQLVGAYLKEVSTWENDKHYSFPHKATQEFLGAYNIILQVTGTSTHLDMESLLEQIYHMNVPEDLRSKFLSVLTSYTGSNVTLRNILEDLHRGEWPLPLAKYQNLLFNIINLSQITEMMVSDGFIIEALTLLKESGMANEKYWITILKNIKCNVTAASWIANNYNILEGEITIYDYSFDAYMAVLKATREPLGTKPELVIDIVLIKVAEAIDELARILIAHGLKIRFLQLKNLHDGRESIEGISQENGLRLLVQNCREMYEGVWLKDFQLLAMRTSEEGRKKLWVKVEDTACLRELYAELLTIHLYQLRLCVDADFGPMCPTEDHRIPDETIDYIDIELQDIMIPDDAGRIIKALHPQNTPFTSISFRRMCDLEEEDYVALMESLRGISVRNGIFFPTSTRPSSASSQQRIQEECKKMTGYRNLYWRDDLDV